MATCIYSFMTLHGQSPSEKQGLQSTNRIANILQSYPGPWGTGVLYTAHIQRYLKYIVIVGTQGEVMPQIFTQVLVEVPI